MMCLGGRRDNEWPANNVPSAVRFTSNRTYVSRIGKAMIITGIQLRFDCNLTAVRLTFDEIRSLNDLRYDRAAAMRPSDVFVFQFLCLRPNRADALSDAFV